ncbi:anaphase-promoting complex subunit cdc27 [Fusarium equiseti]|uniref:Anaphase-promoting complex subunit cdc27 n=1 Tax=Fusarium equiseti TaxID=61235 RepID=A0ABQ8R023_FUSEQ|nr:anaphase-promoting complex subunit cdc27 [Fusarium equiseti]
MAPTPTAVNGLLRQAIHYHLDNASYDNALFFSERLIAQDPRSSESAYLYALCHLRLGDFRSAYDASKLIGYRGAHFGCAWVFAQACLALERYKDGINALEKARGFWASKCNLGKHSATARSALPDAPAVLCLLGRLHRGYDDKKKAVSCYEEALQLNPLMWDAFSALCDLGVTVRVPNIFKASDALVHSFDVEASPILSSREGSIPIAPDVPAKKTQRGATAEAGNDPFSSSHAPAIIELTNGDSGQEGDKGDFMQNIQEGRMRYATSTNSSSGFDGMETPPGPISSFTGSSRLGQSHEPPQAPPRRTRQAQAVDQGYEAPPRMNYRIGSRRTRAQDKGQQDQSTENVMTDASNSAPSASLRSSIPAAERKRTVSGHPAQRVTNSEEPAITRRSARLNMFRPSSKANSGATMIGTSAPRELKKARPPISRIVRPGSSGNNVGRVVSGNRKPLEDPLADVDHGEVQKSKDVPPPPPIHKSLELDAQRLEEGLKWILDLTKKLANGYYSLSQFQCTESIQHFQSLPASHQNTPWVLAQMGRAHYEQASYAEAEKFFRKMRLQAPSRLEDMEVYSTILWHLRRETDLSFLAHELVDSAWLSPQAWCALGNAWSLARDHEQALKCFKRATQLDPKFAYAFTLQGHEYVTNEEYDKAQTAYRQAISADKRHYNAYYGIGRVQERLGAYDKAYTHFHAAQSINPNNAVLITCIGTVLEKQKQIMPALQAYSKAVELAPRAAQTRYKKARALLAVGQLEPAQKELMILKDLAPDEATVHFLLGKLYRNMGEKQLSVRHFTIALALDPKASQQIKEAIESFEDDVEMDDSMM